MEKELWINVKGELSGQLPDHTMSTWFEPIEPVVIDDEKMAPGTLPSIYIGDIAESNYGARPLGLPGYYPMDNRSYQAYAQMARTDDGFHKYMNGFLNGETQVVAE